MGVYQIIYETIIEGNIIPKTHHIEAQSFEQAALYAIEFSRKYQHPVKAVGFLFKIADRVEIQPPDATPEQQPTKGGSDA